jgi:hypothetical protein
LPEDAGALPSLQQDHRNSHEAVQAGRTEDDGVSALEKQLGLVFPADYRNFLLTINGGRPDPYIFDGGAAGECILNEFYGIGTQRGLVGDMAEMASPVDGPRVTSHHVRSTAPRRMAAQKNPRQASPPAGIFSCSAGRTPAPYNHQYLKFAVSVVRRPGATDTMCVVNARSK